MHSCGRGDAFLKQRRCIFNNRGRWTYLSPSTGRDFAVFSRPTALSKCRRPHFCGKIAAGGDHFTPPPGAVICQRYHILRKKIPYAAAIHRPQKKDGSVSGTILYLLRPRCLLLHHVNYYIMPPIPPAGIAGAGSFSGISAMAHSVVRNIPATEAAFSRATRDTLVGSMTPASYMLTNSSVLAL